jgi:hypothetical protein
MLPSAYPEVLDRPALQEILRVQVDMQFVDLKTLLQLPRPTDGLEGGCNLTAAALVTSLIAGASVLFWRASIDALTQRGDRSERFRSLVAAKYPWCDLDDVDGELGARLLWDYTRNPLSHTLGIRDKPRLFPGMPEEESAIALAKADAFPAEQVDELMASHERPNWLGPTVQRRRGAYIVRVHVLAWGVHRLLRDLFADEEQAEAAEATAQTLLHG